MIYLKNLNSQVKEFKDSDMRTVDVLIDSGRWEKVVGLKDTTPLSIPKKVVKKSKKSKKPKKNG